MNYRKFLVWLLFAIIPTKSHATFTYVTTHQYAIQQPTQKVVSGVLRNCDGRTIKTLDRYQSSIYAGYGDWGCNTGPIRMCRLTPPSNNFVCEFTFNTEAVESYRALNGDLFAVGADPMGPVNAHYAVRKNGSWSQKAGTSIAGFSPPHHFDMSYYAGSLWFSSQQYNPAKQIGTGPYDGQFATLYKSTNGGSSWTIGLEMPIAGFSRFQFGGVYNNKLYVQPQYGNGGGPLSQFHYSKVYDGSSWSNGPDLLPFGLGKKARAFSNALLMIQNDHMTAFNGTTTSAISPPVTDYTTDSGYLYILRTTDKKVYRTDKTDGSGYLLVDQAPSNADSIEVLNNVLYAGTTNSQIHKSDVDLASIQPPVMAPVNMLLLLDD